MFTAGPGERAVSHGRDAVQRILEHRAPFLFVDEITAVDLDAGTLRARRVIDPADPVFAGHFPGKPFYPGVLSLETMGQVGLCALYFHRARTVEIPVETTPQPARAIFVHHAAFISEVLPGDELEALATVIDCDEYTAVCAGQLLRPGGVIAAVGVMEVYFVDE
jgi:3-hydroxymyristoyl/3-hydroxydecanoyl-(acyl carrier protein) dehydratase